MKRPTVRLLSLLRALDAPQFVARPVYRVGRRTFRDITLVRRRDGGWDVQIDAGSVTDDFDDDVLRDLAHLLVDAAEEARAAS